MDALGFLLFVGLVIWGISRLLVGKRKPYRDLEGIKTTADVPLPSEEKQSAREAARNAQLKALRDAAPSSPPERMRATIQVNEYKAPRLEQLRKPNLIGEDSFEYVEVGEDFKFSVDMILEMSEAERALIKQHELDDIVLEDVPRYSEDELVQLHLQEDQRIRAKKGYLNEAMERQFAEDADESRKKERSITRVGDLLVSPYSRPFDSPHEASDYADKLKTKFLPEVRKMLDRYKQHKKTETLEF